MQTELREATQQERDNHFLKVKSDIIQDIFKSIKAGTWSFDEDEFKVGICEGDFYLDGDMEFPYQDYAIIMITGNMEVTGFIRTYVDEPDTFLIVHQNLKAKNLMNLGFLEVWGDMTIEESLVGDYNHGAAYIAGNVKANFYYPEEHYFDIRGKTDFNFDGREDVIELNTEILNTEEWDEYDEEEKKENIEEVKDYVYIELIKLTEFITEGKDIFSNPLKNKLKTI